MATSRVVAACSALSLLMSVGGTSFAEAGAGHDSSGTTLGSALVGSAPAGVGASAVAYDAATQTIYVANGNNANGPNAGGNTVSVIDGRRCTGRDVHRCAGPWPTVTVGNEPSTLTVDPATHTVYVTNVDDDTVSVIDGRTCNGQTSAGCGQTAPTVRVGAAPTGIFADESNHTIYVGNFGDGTVSIIDSATCNGIHPSSCPTTQPPTFNVGDGPGDIDVNQQTHTAYVTTLTGLTAFDNRTCNATTQTGCGQVGTFTICGGDCYGPFSSAVDPANNTIYEGNGDTTVAAIDGNACNADNLSECESAPFGTVTLPNPGFGDHIIGVAVDVRLHTVYALLQKDDVAVVIDANICNGAHPSQCSDLVPAHIHTGADPESIVVDERTHTLYVANQVDNTISVIDASRCNAAVTVGCLHRPPTVAVPAAGGIAADELVHTVYVTSGANAVAMIDSGKCNAFHPQGCGQPSTTVTVGDRPTAIAVDDSTNTAYVANGGVGSSGTISMLDTRTCNARVTGCVPTAMFEVPAGNPTDIAVNVITNTIYVATATGAGGSNVISVFDGATCNATTTTGCAPSPALMTVGPSNGCSNVDVAVNQATNTIYATNLEYCNVPILGDTVYVYNGATCGAADTTGCGDPSATVTAGFNPTGIAVDEETNTIYAPLLADGEGAGWVAVINGAICNGTNTSGCGQTPSLAPAGFGPVAAAIDPTTHAVYVTNVEDTSLSVIEGTHCNGTRNKQCGRTNDKVAVDDYPGSLAIDPTVGTAYVTSGVKGTVSVIRLKRRG